MAEELERPDARPLCLSCLEPHSGRDCFCAACGAPVGEFTNYLPFERLFSVGHALRRGTSGNFRATPFKVIAFLMLGFANYGVFAPVYWIQFFRNHCRCVSERRKTDTHLADSKSSA